jgi:hypothetical protein
MPDSQTLETIVAQATENERPGDDRDTNLSRHADAAAEAAYILEAVRK